MFTKSLSLLALGAIIFTTAQAQYAGNAAAIEACKGFAPGSFKCLTDVSYVMCRGGYEQEQFVAAGTYCEQGIPHQRKDALMAGVATATRIFTQNAPADASSAPPASAPATSVLASSAPPTSAAPPPPPPPPSSSDLVSSTSAVLANSVDPITTAVTTFATSAAK